MQEPYQEPRTHRSSKVVVSASSGTLAPGRRHADQDRLAAPAGKAECRLDRFRASERLEGVVDAAVRQVPYRLDGIGRARVDDVRRAELAREVELRGDHVDGDDRRRARDAGSLDDVQPHPAAPDHCDRVARPDAGRVQHRADAGHHRAAHQRELGERKVAVDRDRGAGGHDRPLGERRRVVVVDLCAVAVEAARAVLHRGVVPADVLAEVQLPARTLTAVAAIGEPRQEDVIPRLQSVHARSHLLDDAGALVPQHDGKLGRVDPLGDVEVGVADTARRHPHEHLAGLRRVELELLDDERLAERPQDGGPDVLAHQTPPRTMRRSSVISRTV